MFSFENSRDVDIDRGINSNNIVGSFNYRNFQPNFCKRGIRRTKTTTIGDSSE